MVGATNVGRCRRASAITTAVLAAVLAIMAAACTPTTGGPPPPQTSEDFAWSGEVFDLQRNVAYGPDDQHRLDLYRPKDAGSHNVVIWVHGGFWQDQGPGGLHTKEAVPGFMLDLLLDGWAVASIDYRGSNPEAGDVIHPAHIHDVKRAAAYLNSNGPALSLGYGVRYVGYSAGGHLAAMAAMTYGNEALTPTDIAEAPTWSFVSIAGPTDLVALDNLVDENLAVRQAGLGDYACGSPAVLDCPIYPAYSPVTYAAGNIADALLWYGTGDTLVPASQGLALANALAGTAEVRFELLAGDHDAILGNVDSGALDAWLSNPTSGP